VKELERQLSSSAKIKAMVFINKGKAIHHQQLERKVS
jgi:hypothetical protein